MRRLSLLLLPLLAIVGGCTSHREYYQTRYVPSSSEESYSSLARTSWKGDKEVFELPSQPAGTGDLHRQRRPCALPGPRFKPDAMVGTHDELAGHSAASNDLMGAMDSRPVPGRELGPQWAYPIGTMGNRPPGPVYPKTRPDQMGAMRPAVNQGPTTIRSDVLGGIRPQAKDDYCLPGESRIPKP